MIQSSAVYLEYEDTWRDLDFVVRSCGYYLDCDFEIFTCRPDGWLDYQLVLITNGSGDFEFENEKRTVSKGCAVLFSPNDKQVYRFGHRGSPSYFYLHFGGEGAAKLVESLGLEGKIFELDDMAEFISQYREIMNEIHANRLNFQKECVSRVMHILVLLSRLEKKDSRIKTHDRRIEEAIEHMNRNYAMHKSVDFYADMCGFSVYYFTRLFTKNTGISPNKYITNVCIENAKNLLVYSNLSVKQIANTLGYWDPLYFSRIFKQTTGLSPKNFRKDNDSRQDSFLTSAEREE